jgi:hypothetical protein
MCTDSLPTTPTRGGTQDARLFPSLTWAPRAWPDLGRERKGKASPVTPVARTRKNKGREVWVPMVLMVPVPPAVFAGPELRAWCC